MVDVIVAILTVTITMVDVIVAILTVTITSGIFTFSGWIDRRIRKRAISQLDQLVKGRLRKRFGGPEDPAYDPLCDICGFQHNNDPQILRALHKPKYWKESRRPLEQLIDGKRWP